MTLDPIPELTLRRLPQYYRLLKNLRAAGQETVSASQLAEHLDIHPTQIRKDLASTGSQGRPKVGHRIPELMGSIERFLHWDNRSEAFLVGAGGMGAAVLEAAGLDRAGIRVVAAFDANPMRVGKKLQGVPVMPYEKFEDLVRRMHVAIAILAVPEDEAQEAADLMARSGIQAIWNLSMTPVTAPTGVLVQNADPFASLSVLVRKLAESQAPKA